MRQDWGHSVTNERGRQLRIWELNDGLTFRAVSVSPTKPTFIRGQSILDIIIMDLRLDLQISNNKSITVADYDSDHKAILLNILCQQFNSASTHIHKFNYKSTKWKKFTNKLEKNYNHIIPHDHNLTTQEIDDHLEQINTVIRKTVEETVPRFKNNINSVDKYLNSKIKKLKKDKSHMLTVLNKLLKKDPKAKLPATQTTKSLYAQIKSDLKKEFKKSTDSYWASQIKRIDHRRTDNFFPKINKLLRPHDPIVIGDIKRDFLEPNVEARACITADAPNLITDQTDKLNIGAFFESINTPRHTNIGTRIKEIANKNANEYIEDLRATRTNNTTITLFGPRNPATHPTADGEDIFCDPPIIQSIVKKLPNKLSSGLDDIPPIVLKYLPFNIITSYAIIFNNAINNCYFPTAWKRAKVLPLLKKNKEPANPFSYRPISLTTSISKVYAIIINKKIIKHCEDNNIIPNNQFGFKHWHSTTHAIHKILSDVNTLVGNKYLVAAALRDLEKAFDSGWIKGKDPDKMKLHLNHIINNINSHYAKWNLRINPSKCETVIFRKPVHYLSSTTKNKLKSFKITTKIPGSDIDADIPHVKSVKYLGIHLDELLRGYSHMNIQLDKAKKAFRANSRFRHQSDKRITLTTKDIKWKSNMVYSISIPSVDSMDSSRLSSKYWWLSENSTHIKELKQRLNSNQVFTPP
ncbi:uncharacterized protein LOC130670386 [Microplitis mediator]|uniref:uncharacterized protein LOC130670386 n=1 Tax=Microplitis mediator TaxID=375433 RepID=UPI0025527808|nr:uncharacterized protein LOC130670386 [Microplitis mediator]